MSKLNGTKMRVLVNGIALGGCKSFTLNFNCKNMDTSSKDSGAHTNRDYAEDDWDVSFEALYDPALLMNVEEIYTLINNKTTKPVLEMAVIDGTGGGLVYRGTALPKNLTLVAPKGQPVTISGGFEADGALTQGTVATS